MRAWSVERPGPIERGPLVLGERPDPKPEANEILVQVTYCGVCRTDLHLAEGDLVPHRPSTVPGHEVVGVVVARGAATNRFEVGQRVGIAWLRHTCGACRFCRRGDENLCLTPRFTGWDADGGFAELTTVDEAFACALPDGFDDASAGPLLCSGIIGYRALQRAELPEGGRLGIYGFGASAHLVAQMALARDAEVHVFTRAPEARRLALELGATAAGDSDAEPDVPLDSAILFAPVGHLVPVAMRALDRGGTLAIAGIHLSDIPAMNYDAELFQERQMRSVTANTRADGEALLALAESVPLRPTVTTYGFERVDEALRDVAADRLTGAAVVSVGGS
jgi:propanol-preferring alcohol dehydrogenase